MDWLGDYRIELAVDRAAAALFSGAAGVAVSALIGDFGLATFLVIAVAFRLAYSGLTHIPAGRGEALRFQIAALEPVQVHETRYPAEFSAPILRLVRSQPGEHDERSRKHAHRPRSMPQPPDAAQALSEALAQVRRSLC